MRGNLSFTSPHPTKEDMATGAAVSKIHTESRDTVESELDLFKVPPTRTSRMSSEFIRVRPTTAPPTKIYEFVVPESESKYTDLRECYFRIEGKVVKANGTDLDGDAANVTVWPVNNFAHALFETCKVDLNGVTQVYKSNYGVDAYVDTLVHQTSASKSGKLSVSGWFDDSVGKTAAASMTERKELIKGSRTFSLTLYPNVGLFKGARFLPPGTRIAVQFKRAKDSFCLMSEAADNNSKVEVTTMEFNIKRIEANASVYRAHTGTLLSGHDQQIPFKRTKTRTQLVNAAVSSAEFTLDQHTTYPDEVIVTLTKHSATNGAYKESPVVFRHEKLESIELLRDGTPFGHRIETDFANGNYAQAFTHNLAELGYARSQTDNGITLKMFGDGCTFFAWNLNPSHPEPDEPSSAFHLKRKGSLGFRLRFKEALAHAVTVNITEVREDLMSIDLEKRIHTASSAL